ncbi:hypothetical protein ABK040_011887 [Willaertia magna]
MKERQIMHQRSLTIGKNGLFLFLLIIILFINILEINGFFGSSNPDIKVFLIPHSHIDQGWLRTVREYQSETFTILDNSVNSLLEKEHRKFVWGDVLYFKEWFEQQNPQRQQQIKKLVKSKRFEIVGGGWVQTDEACVSYTSIINEMTVGHEYLLRRFGIRPRVAWQIDPFGHEGRIPQLFSEMGFDALVINRVHFAIKQVMKDEKSLQFLWNISQNKTIFTEVLHTHYSAPRGFDFENAGVELITDHNIDRRANEFIDDMRKRSAHYRTGYLLVPFGDDFKFKSADRQFSNMDRLIDYINKRNSGVTVQYSTVTDYFEALSQDFKDTKYPVVKHDFVPYADNSDSYWTGYFTSLPNLKRAARKAESILTATEMLYALARVKMTHEHTTFNWVDTFNSIQRSRQTVGLVQHHDAITGTCRKHVYNDYMSQLASAIQDMKFLHKSLVKHVLEIKEDTTVFEKLEIDNKEQHTIIVHNSLSHSVRQTINVDSKCKIATITDSEKNQLDYQVIPNADYEQQVEDASRYPYGIYFSVNVDGQGFESISFKCKDSIDHNDDLIDTNVLYTNEPTSNYNTFTERGVKVKQLSSVSEKDLIIENDIYQITLDKETGYLKQVFSKFDNKLHVTNLQFAEFKTVNSGSYIFRPMNDPIPLENQSVKFIYLSKGDFIERAYIRTSRIIIIITLTKNTKDLLSSHFIDFKFDINPLPENSEMVARFGVGNNNRNDKNSMLVYDGFNFVKRTVHQSAPQSGRFYPSTNGAILKTTDGSSSSSQLTVLTDHSMAVTTRDNNNLEFMIHRRLMRDDGRGMSEANNDFSALKFRTSISYTLGTKNEDFVNIHLKSFLINRQLISYLVHGNVKGVFTGFNNNFPKYIEMITLQARGISSDEIGLRLQNLHPSKEMEIDLTKLFSEGVEISDIRERSLNYIYDRKEEKKKLRFKPDRVIAFDFTKQVKKTNEGGQNTEEEGVFLSDEAIAAMKDNPTARKLLSFEDLGSALIKIPPSSIRTYFVALTPTGKGFVNIEDKIDDEDQMSIIKRIKEIDEINSYDDIEEEEREVPQEKLLENQRIPIEPQEVEENREEKEEEKKEDKRVIIEENHENYNREETENKPEEIMEEEKRGIPYLYFIIGAVLLIVVGRYVLKLVFAKRRGRRSKTILPMLYENAGVKTH